MTSPFTHLEEMYAFLQVVKEKKIVNVRDLSDVEILLAEELTEAKLLIKKKTRTTTFYTYGVTTVGDK